MYSQLGDLVFQKVHGFKSMVSNNSARFAEHPLIDGKSILQKTGNELETKNIDIYVHRQFIEPQPFVDTLKNYLSIGAILPFIDGNGKVYGDFVLFSVNETVTELSPTGGLIAATVQLVLKEYIDPNPELTTQAEALKSATALEENGIVPVRNTAITPTPIGLVTASVTSTKSSALESIDLVSAAATDPAQSDSLFKKASAKLDQAKEAASSAIDKMQEANGLAAKAPQLVASLEAVRDNIILMKTHADNKDLSNATTQGEALLSSLDGMETAVLPLNFNQISRRP